MCFKTILLHATNEQRLDNQLAAAGALVGRGDAGRSPGHVVGLAVLPAAMILPAGTPGHPDVVTIDEQRLAFDRSAKILHARLEGAAQRYGFTVEWRLEDAARAPPAAIALAAARTADLVITTGFDSGWRDAPERSTMERLLLESGRPLLLVPKILATPFSTDRILVAWNGSQTATRAVRDALPVLKLARHVKLLHFTMSSDPESPELGSVARLAQSLGRHGVVAQADELGLRGTDAGPAILSAVKAENADLLVMGCYGRSRLREIVFGGATRHVLHHMTVPVLMSH